MDNIRLSWQEIKEKYPHQYVGLVDIEHEKNNSDVKSAIILYTDKDKSYDELTKLAFEGKIMLMYTTSDEDEIFFNGYQEYFEVNGERIFG